MAKIGDRSSVLQRIDSFVTDLAAYTGTAPDRVHLFAEDFGALEAEDLARFEFPIERGPSIGEYS